MSSSILPANSLLITSQLPFKGITNNSPTVPIKLIVSSSTEAMSYLIATGSSYMMSTSKMTGSISGLSFDNIKSVKIEPSGSSANIEYYIITT